MNRGCQEFERGWHARLDAGGDGPGVPRLTELSDHAGSCPGCRDRHAGYLRLVEAMAVAWVQPTALPEGVAERLLTALAAESSRTPLVGTATASRWGVSRWAIAAAALLALGASFWYLGSANREIDRVGPGRVEPEVALGPGLDRATAEEEPETPSLNAAIADLTWATLTLARETSGPEARLGRIVMASTVAEVEPDPDDLEIPTTPGEPAGLAIPAISSPARHAFGFLLGTTPPLSDVARGDG